MDREQKKDDLIAFLRTMQAESDGFDSIAEDASLIGNGIADSLDLLNVITYIEQRYSIDFTQSDFDPDEFGTLGGILNVIERHAGP